MDYRYTEMLNRVISTRQTFFSPDFMTLIPPLERTASIREFIVSETLLMASINASYRDALDNRISNIVFTLGVAPSLDPVLVTATPEQIEETLIPHTPTDDSCAICQDSIAEHCVRLRLCNHLFHNNCIRAWFERSVKCPVCNHDIREEDQEDETSSDESEMTSHLQGQ